MPQKAKKPTRKNVKSSTSRPNKVYLITSKNYEYNDEYNYEVGSPSTTAVYLDREEAQKSCDRLNVAEMRELIWDNWEEEDVAVDGLETFADKVIEALGTEVAAKVFGVDSLEIDEILEGATTDLDLSELTDEQVLKLYHCTALQFYAVEESDLK